MSISPKTSKTHIIVSRSYIKVLKTFQTKFVKVVKSSIQVQKHFEKKFKNSFEKFRKCVKSSETV